MLDPRESPGTVIIMVMESPSQQAASKVGLGLYNAVIMVMAYKLFLYLISLPMTTDHQV